jgi:hypothetical protein
LPKFFDRRRCLADPCLHNPKLTLAAICPATKASTLHSVADRHTKRCVKIAFSFVAAFGRQRDQARDK